MGRLPCIWLVWRVCDVGERNTRPQSASSLAKQSADGYSTRTHWKQQARRGKTFGKMWVFQRKSSEDVVSIEEIITILFLFYLFASSEDFRWKTHVFPNVFPIFRRKTHVFPNVRHASATKVCLLMSGGWRAAPTAVEAERFSSGGTSTMLRKPAAANPFPAAAWRPVQRPWEASAYECGQSNTPSKKRY